MIVHLINAFYCTNIIILKGRRGRDRIVVGFITTVPDLDKERPYANPLVRPLLIHHLHDWRKME
jgi:hypothetical protein